MNLAHPHHAETTTAGALAVMFDYDVLDCGNEKIGVVNNLWPDENGRLAYVGVRTGWLLHKDYLIPADGVEIHHDSRTVQLPYTAQTVKDAPEFDSTGSFPNESVYKILYYYGTHDSATVEEAIVSDASTAPEAPQDFDAQARDRENASENEPQIYYPEELPSKKDRRD